MPSSPKLLGTPEVKSSGVPDLGLIQALPITSYGPWASDITSLCLSSPSVRFSPRSHMDEKAVITTLGAGPGKVRAESKAGLRLGLPARPPLGFGRDQCARVSQRTPASWHLYCCAAQMTSVPPLGHPVGGRGLPWPGPHAPTPRPLLR